MARPRGITGSQVYLVDPSTSCGLRAERCRGDQAEGPKQRGAGPGKSKGATEILSAKSPQLCPQSHSFSSASSAAPARRSQGLKGTCRTDDGIAGNVVERRHQMAVCCRVSGYPRGMPYVHSTCVMLPILCLVCTHTRGYWLDPQGSAPYLVAAVTGAYIG